MMQVTILSTGNELLYGKTADTNSGYIASRLFPLDLRVRFFMTVGDDADDLEQTIRNAVENSDIVIMTGGLGPTDDDNSIAALRRIFGFPVVIDEGSRGRMESFFEKRGLPMNNNDLKMAEVPAGAMVLPNEKGLAPGFIIRHNDKTVIAMPGVPVEAIGMMERSVIPFLQHECGIGKKRSLSFKVIAMKESDINASLLKMALPLDSLDWGMTAREGITTVTFVEKGTAAIDFNAISNDFRRVFGESYLDPLWDSPEEEVIDILRNMKMTVAFAESCTGGLISKRITDVPGSSDVFTGGIVAYSNSVKTSQLGVSGVKLEQYGAVSPEVAAEMAAGARTKLKSDIGISTTGIAGPGGGSESKPVGTVWFGLSDEKGVTAFSIQISGGRELIRSMAALIAIENFRRYLKHLMVSRHV